MSTKLDTSKALQNKFDLWAGNLLGGKRRQANAAAAAEILERSKVEHSTIKEVFEHDKFDPISRTWTAHGLVLCADHNVACDDLFDPAVVQLQEKSHWVIDYSLLGTDAEGWTYAFDFASLNRTGAGEPSPKWNSYVRRRKWRFVDRAGAVSDAIDE